jgi:diguanylate cyclase (GGDEF)-like protein
MGALMMLQQLMYRAFRPVLPEPARSESAEVRPALSDWVAPKTRLTKRALYAVVGALLGLGAPLGWLLLRELNERRVLPLDHVLGEEGALYTYLLVGTSTAFAIFGFVVGRLSDRLTRMNRHLAEVAITDPLTGLYNPRYFKQRLQEERARAARHEASLSLIVLDLDHFKRVNDRFGHPVGDAVLTHAARVISDTARASDIACRIGGEEFAVICPLTSSTDAAALAERIRTKLERTPSWTGSGKIELTASFGVAEVTGAKAALLERADAALYRAKAAGRNQVVQDG